MTWLAPSIDVGNGDTWVFGKESDLKFGVGVEVGVEVGVGVGVGVGVEAEAEVEDNSC